MFSFHLEAGMIVLISLCRLLLTYQEIPHQFWGFIVDIDEFESKLMTHLEGRAKGGTAVNQNSTYSRKPVSTSWLAVLFAMLAVGSQYSDSPYHLRTRDSQKYIQVAFHFLRHGNFLSRFVNLNMTFSIGIPGNGLLELLSRPTLDSIQALLMTSFILLNEMKAEASWALLSLTCRLAQSLGLDRSLPALPPWLAAHHRSKEQGVGKA